MNPAEQIFVLKDGKRLGPFSPDDLLDQIECGAVNYEDACLRSGSTQVERIREVLDWDEPSLPDESPLTESEAAADDHPTIRPEPAITIDSGGGDEDLFAEEDLEDFDLDEEIQETLEEFGDPDAGGPPSNPSTILYAGHPSFLSFPRTVLLIAVSAGAGLWFRETSSWIFLAGLIIALFGVSWIFLERSTRLYLITPRRVEIVTGLFAKSSNEVRIDDIRTINVVKTGIIGLLGVGTVEFASAGGSTVEVSFQDVWAANRIKSLVRRLQDAQER